MAPCLKFLGAVLAVLCGLNSAAATPSLPDLIDQVRPSIVGIGTYLPTRRPPAQLLGSGFVVADGLSIATNLHVIPDSLDASHREKLVVFVGRGNQPELREAVLAKRDPRHDMALLTVKGTPIAALQLASDNSAREGEAVAFTGFPIGAVLGLYPVTHRGIIAAISPVAIPAARSGELSAERVHALRNPYNVLQLDAIAYPGNSGSPVYRRRDGKVIGIINRVLVRGRKENVLKDPSGITYAIPVSFLRKLLGPSASPGE